MSLNRQLAVAATIFLLLGGGALWLRGLELDAMRDFVRQNGDGQQCGSELTLCRYQVERP